VWSFERGIGMVSFRACGGCGLGVAFERFRSGT
jgi:hypothetical protein